jgi:RHS repeat-associated protein
MQQGSYKIRNKVVSVNDYYPFGSLMPQRSFASEGYRFGFNGMEKDDEVKGSGNSLDFGARIYDSRLGRFLSMDPLSYQFAWQSPYVFAANNPNKLIDIYGEAPGDPPTHNRVAKVRITTSIMVEENNKGRMLKEGETITDYQGITYEVGTTTTDGGSPFSGRIYKGQQSLYFKRNDQGYWLFQQSDQGGTTEQIKKTPTNGVVNPPIRLSDSEKITSKLARQTVSQYESDFKSVLNPDEVIITDINVEIQVKNDELKGKWAIDNALRKSVTEKFGDNVNININYSIGAEQDRIILSSNASEAKTVD